MAPKGRKDGWGLNSKMVRSEGLLVSFSVYVSTCPFLSLSLSLLLSFCLSVSVSLSLFLCVCVPLSFSAFPASLSQCHSLCLLLSSFIFVSVCVSLCLSLSVSLSPGLPSPCRTSSSVALCRSPWSFFLCTPAPLCPLQRVSWGQSSPSFPPRSIQVPDHQRQQNHPGTDSKLLQGGYVGPAWTGTHTPGLAHPGSWAEHENRASL